MTCFATLPFFVTSLDPAGPLVMGVWVTALSLSVPGVIVVVKFLARTISIGKEFYANAEMDAASAWEALLLLVFALISAFLTWLFISYGWLMGSVALLGLDMIDADTQGSPQWTLGTPEMQSHGEWSWVYSSYVYLISVSSGDHACEFNN
eukprot:COSAG04_NODE_2550_length_3949_cov_3.795325_4_plen_150_part_00